MKIFELQGAELDEECSLWDWARTAGLSAGELRDALRRSGELAKTQAAAEPQPAIAWQSPSPRYAPASRES